MLRATDLAQLRRRIDLPIARGASGLLDGAHPSLLRGHGDEFDDLSLYSPGDDVSDIDWKASARAGVPVIKRFESRRNIPVVLAVDTGRTMAATAASGETKGAVAAFTAALLAGLARDRNDSVGLVAADAGRLVRLPARSGTGHVQLLVRQVERAFGVRAPESDLGRVVRRAEVGPRRSLVVLVTDDGAPSAEHEPALRRLRGRHELLVVSVADADPLAPPATERGHRDARPTRDVGDGWTVPAELRGRRDLQEALARHRAERRAARAALLRRLDATDVVVGGTAEVVPALAAVRRRRARR